MRTDGQPTGPTHTGCSRSCPLAYTSAYKYAVSGAHFDEHAVTDPFPNERTHLHTHSHEFAYCVSVAAGRGYAGSNLHSETYNLAYCIPTFSGHRYSRSDGHDDYRDEHAYADSGADIHPDSRAYAHSDIHTYTVADANSNCDDCPNGDIHTNGDRHIVPDFPTYCCDCSYNLNSADPATSTYRRPDRHAHAEFNTLDRRQRSIDCLHLLRRCGVKTGTGRVRGNRQHGHGGARPERLATR